MALMILLKRGCNYEIVCTQSSHLRILINSDNHRLLAWYLGYHRIEVIIKRVVVLCGLRRYCAASYFPFISIAAVDGVIVDTNDRAISDACFLQYSKRCMQMPPMSGMSGLLEFTGSSV
ncbi:hypothetical protein RB195_003113 [Necator americanus]|uniref:Uncharacterized protein n=1 Tax=Necator americanus TaxID=51031 RepID=A0ABR1DM34_NECAM